MKQRQQSHGEDDSRIATSPHENRHYISRSNLANVDMEEAQQLCERLAAESSDRDTHQWLPTENSDGSWSVVKVSLPPTRSEDRKAEVRGEEKPPTPDDPRSGASRNLGRSYG
jgi:hypothetical protein